MGDQYLVFTGRPNAGKSSIIRAVTGLKVDVGKDPGTTQRIMRHQIAEGLTLIDMPGYGRSLHGGRDAEERTKDDILAFLKDNAKDITLAVHVVNISTYLETEARLAKKGFIPVDVEMVHYMKRDLGIPVLVAMNKIDKGPQDYIMDNVEALKEGLGPSIPVFPLSARTGDGVGPLKDEVRKKLAHRGFTSPFESIR
jgi:GTP-binding protein EngB required for normal cell division